MVTWGGAIDTMLGPPTMGLRSVAEKFSASELLSTSPQKLQPELTTKPRMVCGALDVVRVVSTSRSRSSAGATVMRAVFWLVPAEAEMVTGLLSEVTPKPLMVKLTDC